VEGFWLRNLPFATMNGPYFDLESFANAIQLQQPSQQAQQHRYIQNGPSLDDYDPTNTRLMDPLSMLGYTSTTHRHGQQQQQQQQQHQHQHHRTLMPSTAAPGTSARLSLAAPMAAPPGTFGGPMGFGLPDFEPLPLSKPQMLHNGSGGSSSHHRASHTNGTNRSASSSSTASASRIAAAMARANIQAMEDEMLNPSAAMFSDLFGPRASAAAAASACSSSRRRRNGTHSSVSNNSSRQQQQLLAAIPRAPAQPVVPEPPEPWLEAMRISVSGLSLEPLTGTEITTRLRIKTEDVVTRYLPCVDFLVACQQELRKGLASAQQKLLVHHMLRDAMTPRQFYNTYIEPLPDRFHRKNRRLMDAASLNTAVQEIQKLCKDASGVELQGCEVMKNTFLGGMKDGESWGLRKWLSKNGGALQICNDCECILNACQKLDRSKSDTSKLAGRLRPLAKKALTKLKSDVPSSYQEISSAHPYLPFFHRLESTLKGMSNFDPDDDDVICIDDNDEIEEVKAKAAESKPPPATSSSNRKRNRDSSSSAAADTSSKKSATSASSSKKRKAEVQQQEQPAETTPVDEFEFRGDDDDDESVIEVFASRPKATSSKKSKVKNKGGSNFTSNPSSLGSVGSDDEYMSTLFSSLDDAETEFFDTSSATGKDGNDNVDEEPSLESLILNLL
jgi:hypothetical protein